MAFHTVNGIQNQNLLIDTYGDSWLVDKGATFENYSVVFDNTAGHNRVLLNGDIDVNGVGIYEAAGASSNNIILGKDANISAYTAASLNGRNTSFTNHGTMGSTVDDGRGAYLAGGVQLFRNFGTIATTGGGESSGIQVEGTEGLTIENHGMITSKASGIDIVSGNADIVNANGGRISGDQYGVWLGSNQQLLQSSLVNAGTISSKNIAVVGSIAGDIIANSGRINGRIWLQDGNDSFVNNGVVNGNIDLGIGNDHFSNNGGKWTAYGSLDAGKGDDTIDLRGGTVIAAQGMAAQILGGEGDDTYIVDSTTFDLQEASDGIDTVKSSVSFTLANDFENLTLLGKTNLDGSGNNSDNVITGNAGDNVLRGMGGEDVIDGGAGIDTLVFDPNGAKGVIASLLVGKVTGADDLYSFVSNVENVRGTQFDDLLNGDDKANVIEGGAGGDTLDGNGGKDTVSYQHSSAGVNVDLKTNVISGGDAEGDALLYFENLLGSSHNDTLGGDDGENRITGGQGNDHLTGYGGADVFIFTGHFGKDEITDFSGKDRIDFSEGPMLFKNFDAMMDHVTVSGDDVIIHHGKDTLTLDNMDISDLHASQFHF